MDFLNKAQAQASDLFRSMTPGARITAGLLLAVIVISLGYLFTNQASGPDSLLLGGQSFAASEMPAMEAAFGKAGLGDYTVEGNRIRIPHGQQAAYMGALADAGALPHNFSDHLSDALLKSSPWTSKQQQEEMLKVAKQKELALIIRSMQGIENAAVLYDSQKKSAFGQSRAVTATASVKPRGNLPLAENQVPMIRHLVAGAIAGLAPESVTVVDLNGKTYRGGTAGSLGADGLDNPYLSLMKNYQTQYEASVLAAFPYVPGITVTANVELDREMHSSEDRVKVDPKTVPLRIRENSNTENSEAPANGGRPGLEAQQRANSPAALTATSKGPTSSTEQTDSETESVASHDHTKIERVGLTPKLVKFSIGIPSDYFLKVWREKNPAPVGQPAQPPDASALEKIEVEETAKIRKAAAALVPNVDATVDATTLVTVTTFQSLPSEAIPEPALTSQAITWLSGSWSTLGMVLLALVSLLMLRSLLKAPPPLPPAAERPAAVPANPDDDEEGTDDEIEKKNRLKRRLGSGVSLRDELVEMVRDNPDAAANILRGWIGDAN